MVISVPSRRSFSAVLPVLLGALLALTGPLSATTRIDTETGLRLLQKQLPVGTTPALTDCEHLSSAVVRATYGDRSHAPDILAAALSAGIDKDDPDHRTSRRPCACVVRIFRNVVIVAPAMASALLETASAIYPDCAESLTEALDGIGDKNPVDGKDYAPAAPHTAADRSAGTGNAPGLTNDPALNSNPGLNNDPGMHNDPGLTGDRDFAALGLAPGFPGAPGFVGSPASGGIALAPPTTRPVTSVVNE